MALEWAAVARTKHVRIGSAINILPFHNPILAAEEAATLDVLSDFMLQYTPNANPTM